VQNIAIVTADAGATRMRTPIVIRPPVQGFLIAALCVVLAACETGPLRSNKAPAPARPAPPAAPAATPVPAVQSTPVAMIRVVQDVRVFEQDAEDPSVPSLASGGPPVTSIAEKSRVVARERTSFGKPTGNVQLPNEGTVTGVIGENLSAALAQAGYTLGDASSADQGVTDVSVRVRQFWAWFEPGFWSITLHARIVTEIELGGHDPLLVEGSAEHTGKLAGETAWSAVMDKALAAWREQLAAKLPPPAH
jgi:hypothetical protein